MTHTPGPWHITDTGIAAADGTPIVSDALDTDLETGEGIGCLNPNYEADYPLIAAAPALLEALETLTNAAVGQNTVATMDAVGKAHAAIALAKGESK